VPTAFVAVTVKVYAVPLLRPVTVIGDAAPLTLMPPGEEVTVYEVIAEPPLEAGGVNAIEAWVFPAVAVPIVGGPGTAPGVTLFEGADAGPVPTALVALTVNVYAVPLVSPLRMMGEPGPLATIAPGEDVAVYDVTGEPFDAAAVNATPACVLPAAAMRFVGAPGTPAGVTLFDGADAGPAPTALVAVTVKVYAVPLARPPTVIGEAGPVALMPPGDDVTVYDVIGVPPLEMGGVNATVACALPAVATTPVGLPGNAAGMTLFEGADAGPVPTALVAVTVKV